MYDITLEWIAHFQDSEILLLNLRLGERVYLISCTRKHPRNESDRNFCNMYTGPSSLEICCTRARLLPWNIHHFHTTGFQHERLRYLCSVVVDASHGQRCAFFSRSKRYFDGVSKSTL